MRKLALRQSMRRLGDEFGAFCEHWIGYALPPADRTVGEAGWVPNARAGYCHRCGQSVGPGEANSSGCGDCRGRSPLDGVVRLGSFADDLREWIHATKYRGWSDMGSLLGTHLGRAIERAGIVDRSHAVVVPMAMPWLRRLFRGTDHAEVIASATARVLHAPIVRMLAKGNGPLQTNLPRTLRPLNARRGMRLRRRLGGWPIQGLHVVIVDDVLTTGSSMAAAARLIRPLGPEKIVGAVVAVTKPARRGGSDVAEASPTVEAASNTVEPAAREMAR